MGSACLRALLVTHVSSCFVSSCFDSGVCWLFVCVICCLGVCYLKLMFFGGFDGVGGCWGLGHVNSVDNIEGSS